MDGRAGGRESREETGWRRRERILGTHSWEVRGVSWPTPRCLAWGVEQVVESWNQGPGDCDAEG